MSFQPIARVFTQVYKCSLPTNSSGTVLTFYSVFHLVYLVFVHLSTAFKKIQEKNSWKMIRKKNSDIQNMPIHISKLATVLNLISKGPWLSPSRGQGSCIAQHNGGRSFNLFHLKLLHKK